MSASAVTDARAARRELERLLETEPSTLGEAVGPEAIERLEHYVALLLTANERLNLTRVTEPAAIARLHLLDALSALPHVTSERPERALDLGSGGGVPGIVLAVVTPETHWTLVDSVGKKAAALAGFVDALGLSNVDVRAARAEDLGRGSDRATFDLVTARACAALPVLLEYALPLLRFGGRLIAWKGSMTDAEAEAGRIAAAELGGGEATILPTGIATLGDHVLVVVPKERATPARYPRRLGHPARHPLGTTRG